MSQIPNPLTPDEARELVQSPAGSLITMTEEVFDRRLRLAKKACQFFVDNDPTLQPDFKAVYEQYPMWAFYTAADGLPRRSFGVLVNDDGKASLHTATCNRMFSFSGITFGATPIESLTRVERWDPEQQLQIAYSSAPGMFADPMGFFVALDHGRARTF